MKKLLIFLIGTFFLLSCSDEDTAKKEFATYEGPVMEVDSSVILYSDSAMVRVKVEAPRQLEFENGDKEFPNTIFISFYEPDGTLSSTLDAQKAYYTKETDTYKAEGDVEVIGYLEPQKMNSEELYWEPKKEEIYTDKFVRIETEDQISKGTGMRAKQDFSSYRILNPTGTIYLEDEQFGGTKEEKTNNDPVPAKKKEKRPAVLDRQIKEVPKEKLLDPEGNKR